MDPAENKLRPSRVITVRTTSVLHEALKAQAHQQQMSLNELCNSKLSEGVDLTAEGARGEGLGASEGGNAHDGP